MNEIKSGISNTTVIKNTAELRMKTYRMPINRMHY